MGMGVMRGRCLLWDDFGDIYLYSTAEVIGERPVSFADWKYDYSG